MKKIIVTAVLVLSAISGAFATQGDSLPFEISVSGNGVEKTQQFSMVAGETGTMKQATRTVPYVQSAMAEGDVIKMSKHVAEGGYVLTLKAGANAEGQTESLLIFEASQIEGMTEIGIQDGIKVEVPTVSSKRLERYVTMPKGDNIMFEYERYTVTIRAL